MEGTPASFWKASPEVSAECSQEGTPRAAVSFKSVNQGASEIHLCVNATHFFTTEKLLWINISDVQQGSAALCDIWFRLRSVCGIIIE